MRLPGPTHLTVRAGFMHPSRPHTKHTAAAGRYGFWHFFDLHDCLSTPEPPYLVMSRQKEHWRQSGLVHASHTLHFTLRCLSLVALGGATPRTAPPSPLGFLAANPVPEPSVL